MRILIRTSRWAVLARRLGSFALPLTVIPVLMHRAGAIGTTPFEAVEAVAIIVAVLGLAASIGAFVRIWITGDHGWGRAVAGLLFSLACLTPLGVLAVDFVRYPMADEVTTDPDNPPPLLSAVTTVPPTAAVAARLAAVFPNVRTRNYPLDAGQIFEIVDKLAGERGWDVLARHQPTADSDGQINALATTLFGFRDEVSIRLAATADGGTTVAMRSTALTALHEPGINGSRVESFLTALDDRITQLQKDGPAGTSDDSEDDSSQPPVPAPAPAPRQKKR